MGARKSQVDAGIERLLRLQAATSALTGAVTAAQVADVIFTETAAAIGATSGALWLLTDDGDALAYAGGAGLAAEVPGRFARLEMDAPVPGPQVVRTGEAVFIRSRQERDAEWPALVGTVTTQEAIAVLPLVVEDRVLGCLGFGFPAERSFGAAQRQFLGALADQCAIALDRARLYDAERERREVFAAFVEASAALTSSLDRREIIRRVAAAAVPRLADSCAVYVPEGDTLRRVVLEAAGAGGGRAVDLVDRFPVAIDADTPIAAAYRTGALQAIPEVTADMVASTNPDPAFLEEVVKILPLRSGVAIPLGRRGRVMGVMTFASATWPDWYRGERLEAVRELASRAALAIDNALRFEREERVAATLVRAILPEEVPSIPGVEVAARYLPVERPHADVGGDWYDCWASSGGVVHLSIGDVAGHGLTAAAAMAQVRNAGRAFASEGHPPATVLARLHELLAVPGEPEALVTAVVGDFDPLTGRLTWALAGHPPPLLVRRASEELLEASVGPALGVTTAPVFTEATVDLEPGDVVLWYTDGLIEVRGESLDQGLARLRGAAGILRQGPLAQGCDTLVAEVTGGRQREDDCCILALRRPA